jgi:cobalt-zinc-cadmium efflux system outer membrane protein
MRRLLWPLGLAAALLSPFVVRAQQATTLTLNRRSTWRQCEASPCPPRRRELEALDGALQQAGAPRNPEFSATVEDTHSATRTTTATLDYPLELGGSGPHASRWPSIRETSRKSNMNNAKAQVRASVISAYFAVPGRAGAFPAGRELRRTCSRRRAGGREAGRGRQGLAGRRDTCSGRPGHAQLEATERKPN